MSAPDAIFVGGSLILLAALLPALRARAVLPVRTCALTGGVLATFSGTYAAIGLVYAAAVSAATAGAWLALLGIAWKAARS